MGSNPNPNFLALVLVVLRKNSGDASMAINIYLHIQTWDTITANVVIFFYSISTAYSYIHLRSGSRSSAVARFPLFHCVSPGFPGWVAFGGTQTGESRQTRLTLTCVQGYKSLFGTKSAIPVSHL